MRTGCVLLLASVLAGCASLRGTSPRPAPEIHPRSEVAQSRQPAPAPPPRHLACIQHPRIDAWEHRLRAHRHLRMATQESLERARWYLPRLRRILAKSSLPPSLALLPMVESDFHRCARGRLDDLGLWQFRGETGRRFGLVVNQRRDQRLHPYRATRAAARYLRLLHRHYGDWPLALAAYNAGEQRVDHALARRRGATFWELAEGGYLPRTSREYVPRFLAVVRIVDGVRVCSRPPADPSSRDDVVLAPGRRFTQARQDLIRDLGGLDHVRATRVANTKPGARRPSLGRCTAGIDARYLHQHADPFCAQCRFALPQLGPHSSPSLQGPAHTTL